MKQKATVYKGKTHPTSNNQSKGELSFAKKDGHGKFNWGKVTDYSYIHDPTKGDDIRVLHDMIEDTNISNHKEDIV